MASWCAASNFFDEGNFELLTVFQLKGRAKEELFKLDATGGERMAK